MIAPISSATVAEITSAYLDWIRLRRELRSIRSKTADKAYHYLSNFAKAYGDKPLEACRSGDLISWLVDRPQWKSASTKSDALTAVMSCFRWAVSERLIPYLPYVRPRLGSNGPKLRIAISAKEYATFIWRARNTPDKHRRPSSFALCSAVRFLWHTGCRTCEMRSLRWSDIQWEDGVVALEHHKTDASGQDRLFGLDNATIRLLRRMQRRIEPDPRPCKCELFTERDVEHRIDDHVFRSGRGTAWKRDTFGNLFREYADRAGIDRKRSAYCLRHGWCVQAILAGLSDRENADQLGHAGTRYVNLYGRQARQQAPHLRSVVQRVHA